MAVDYQIPTYLQSVDGKLLINPGDYIFGGNHGVVVVPKEITIKVLELAEEWYESEGKSRKAIAEGKDPFQVYEKFGRF